MSIFGAYYTLLIIFETIYIINLFKRKVYI